MLLLAWTSGAAQAQLARYPRQQPPVPPVELSERVLPPSPAQPAQAVAKPSIDSAAVLSIASPRAPVRAEQEQILLQLIADTPDSSADEKADYYFRLGELYAQQCRFWRVKTGDARACRWQYRRARATLAMPRATDAEKVQAIEALVHVYATQNEPDAECRENAATMAGEIAASYHARWSKTRNLETLGYAERLYASYVAAFPDDADRRATYAEVLWSHADRETNAKLRARRWERCADVFATIATPEATKAAALARMNAVDAVVPATTKVVLAKLPRKKPRERPLGSADAKLVAAVAAYAKQATNPDDALAQMRLVVAMTLRRYRHFDEAATVLDELLAADPKHPRAELAANLLLDSLIQARELDEALEVAAAMASDSSLIEGKRDLQRNIMLLRSRWKL